MEAKVKYLVTVCLDGKEHKWQPVSFVFETQLLDSSGRVLIRQPDIEKARVYMVCLECRLHTYIETRWAGFYLGECEHPHFTEQKGLTG